jgi:hypothetical protein
MALTTYKSKRSFARTPEPGWEERQRGRSSRSGSAPSLTKLIKGQNDYADTLAAPYCVRPYHEPLVSTPLEWREVREGLNRYSFTMDTIHSRLTKKGDIWEAMPDRKIITANNRSLSYL